MDIMSQSLELSKRPHIVIATPGRLVDIIQSCPDTIHFKRIKYLVLDEADRLLTSTFQEDLSVIFDEMPKNNGRQTLLFTATMTDEIEQLSKISKNPFVYTSSNLAEKTPKNLEEKYLFIPSSVRESYLTHILRNEFKGKTMIIFISKARTCEMLRLMIKELGFKSTALHSSMSQPDRISSLEKFKSQVVPILISTDVGSRGLDIPTVEVVINYDLPASATDYIHRVGRTARANRGGLALSIVTERDVDIVKAIESETRVKMTEFTTNDTEVLDILNEVSLAKRVAIMQLFDNNFDEKKRIIREKEDALKKHSKNKKKRKAVE